MAVTFDVASVPATQAVANPSWSHNNSGNAIVVGATYFTGGTDNTTGVTYGGVALSKIGTIPSDNSTAGGVSFWGKIGGLPTGSNTVAVSSSSSEVVAGAMSFAGAGSFGTAVTGFGSGNGGSVSVLGTTSGGIVVSVACFGGTNLTAFSATSPATQRINGLGDSNGGADNLEGETSPSTGGTVAIAWTAGGGGTDFWGQVAVEIIPSGGGGATSTFFPEQNPLIAWPYQMRWW